MQSERERVAKIIMPINTIAKKKGFSHFMMFQSVLQHSSEMSFSMCSSIRFGFRSNPSFPPPHPSPTPWPLPFPFFSNLLQSDISCAVFLFRSSSAIYTLQYTRWLYGTVQ